MSYADRFLETLHRVDDACVAAGGVPISDAWWQTIERYVRSGKRQIVVRKGRRIGASTIIAPRLAVTVLLCSEHPNPPGDTTTIGFVSVRLRDGRRRLRNVGAVLDALHIKYDTRDDTIEPAGFGGRLFRTLTASFRTEVGDLIEFLWGDEGARWVDSDTSANPAAEVMASLRPSLATVEHAQIWFVSSPLGKDDFHARSYDQGDADHQCTAFLPTALANPTLPESKTRLEEPDPQLWQREYGAIPSDSGLAPFADDLVVRAMRPLRPGSRRLAPIAILDPASRHDQFPIVIASYVDEAPPIQSFLYLGRQYVENPDGSIRPVDNDDVKPTRRLAILECTVVGQRWLGKVTGDEMADRIATICNKWGASEIVTDQGDATWTWTAMREQRGFDVTISNWTQSNKAEAVTRLRRLLADDGIVFPADATELREQFQRYVEVIRPSGTVSYHAKNGHDDQVSCVLGAVLCELELRIPGTQLARVPHGRAGAVKQKSRPGSVVQHGSLQSAERAGKIRRAR